MVVERDPEGRFVKGGVGNARGPSERVLTVEELDLVEKKAAQGVRWPGMARLLGCSLSLIKVLRERQPEVEERYARGRSLLHDSMYSIKVYLALHASDERVRSENAAWVLAADFGYRDKGEKINIGIDLDGQRGPSLVVIQEILPSGFPIAGGDPMAQDRSLETTTTREPPVQASTGRHELAGAWD